MKGPSASVMDKKYQAESDLRTLNDHHKVMQAHAKDPARKKAMQAMAKEKMIQMQAAMKGGGMAEENAENEKPDGRKPSPQEEAFEGE